MKLNESNLDRLVRLVLAIVFFVLAFTTLGGVWAIVSGVLGVVMLATAAIGFCPLYALFGINTCPLDQRKA
jgi:hypothetical protein